MNLLGIISVPTPDLGEATSVRFEFYEFGARTMLVAHTLCGATIEGSNVLIDVYANLRTEVKNFAALDNHEAFPRFDEWL